MLGQSRTQACQRFNNNNNNGLNRTYIHYRNFLQWCWYARIKIGGALVAMIKTNKYLTLIKLTEISDIILFSNTQLLMFILQEIFYCRVIQRQICRIVVDLNSTIIKWPIYSNIVISPVSCDADCLVIFPMLKLSFCWSISSTTPTPTIHLYYPLTNMVKFITFNQSGKLV